MTGTSFNPFARISTPAGPIPEHAPAWNRQRHSQMPSHRYRDVYARVAVPLTERDWPARRLTQAPLWVPVDLRDGNQARAEPMDPARKRRFFELMVAMGYQQIEGSDTPPPPRPTTTSSASSPSATSPPTA
jgi:2-isopropylmalate synthase